MPATGRPADIPFPVSSFPGALSQESAGRLVNCYAEPLGEANPATGPARQVWRRSPGMSLFTTTAQSGYRGGMDVAGTCYEVFNGTAVTIDSLGDVNVLGAPLPGTRLISIARNQFGTTPDVLVVDPDNGAFVVAAAPVLPATVTVTLAGSSGGETGQLTFTNSSPDVTLAGWPVNVSSGSQTTINAMAAAFVTAINANTSLTNANVAAAAVGPVITITQQGSIGNDTQVAFTATSGSGITATFNPPTGLAAGGQGIVGIFTGAPTPYTAQGVLPQINSVCFQDSYFFLTSGDNQCFATNNNSLVVNALNFITCEAKADVTLLRGIAYAGVLWLFTTGSVEIWQDVANPPPAFPYNRQLVLETGLLQSGAIAGWETGFSNLCWVSQDFGVYWCPPTQLTPTKISPPDLERLIESEFRNGSDLQAGCYMFAGKKFWHLSSPDWTWEFNLSTQKWNERSSLNGGLYGRWRGVAGHPTDKSFNNKWFIGDAFSGNMLWIDNTNYSENGMTQLFRLESGPVRAFPHALRIARADFDFDMGVGIAFDSLPVTTQNPLAAISVSLDGGQRWGNPRLRSLGQQGKVQRIRASVKNMGLSGPQGTRWRVDVTDPVYVGIMGGSQSSDPRLVGG